MSIDAAPGPKKKGPGVKPRATGWRTQRPFWGAVVCIAGAIELYSVTMAPLSVVVMQGLPGLATLAIASLTIILSILTLAQPHLRSITGWMIIIMGILSVLVSNLGGFVVGMILLVVGGSLLLSWEGPAGSAPAPAGGATEDTVVDGPAAPVGAVANGRPARPPAGRNPVAGGPPGTRPARPPARKRSGLAGVLDTMTGSRPQQKRKPPAKKSAPVRNPGDRNGAPRRPRSTPLPTSGDGISATPSGEQRPATPRPVELSPPTEPPVARARTWILVPLLVGALGASALGAAPATALGGSTRAEGPLDWLFPPAPTPAPSATTPVTPTPSPTQSNGLTLPSLPSLFPQPSASATPSPSASAPAVSAAECSALPDTPEKMKPNDMLDAAAAIRDCATAQATADDPVRKAAAAGAPTVSGVTSILKAKSLTMNGLSYDGIVALDSPKGPIQTLKFSADSVAVAEMDQTYPIGDDGSIPLKNVEGDANITGNVELYVTKMTGKIFGLLELTFDPGFPPPLVTPFLIMTDTTSDVAFVTSDQITLPSFELKIAS